MTGRASPQWPSGASRLVAVMGQPIRHSKSPLLHNAAFDAMGLDWVSVAFEVEPGDAPAALAGMRALGIAGMSVTMPHKQDAALSVDELTPVARALGAVNCVTLQRGRLVGDSTDGDGFLASLAHLSGFDPAGRRCLVVGSGGAARAVVEALARAGAQEVVVLNRHQGRAQEAAALAGARGRVGTSVDLGAAELVVQATPVGMEGGSAHHELVDLALVHGGQVVVDLVYHPPSTALLERAASVGAVTANGLGMLVHQAALAVERWTGLAAPVQAMWRAVADQG